MITNLQFLGIYTDAIDSAIESAENLLRKFDFDDSDIDEMNEWAVQDLEETGSFSDITNSIICSYFSSAKAYVERHFGDADIYYYINCTASHLYCDGEEV